MRYMNQVPRKISACVRIKQILTRANFDVLLTVHLSIVLVTDQLNAQILVL